MTCSSMHAAVVAVQQRSTATTTTAGGYQRPSITPRPACWTPIGRPADSLGRGGPHPRSHDHASTGAACSGRRHGSVAEAGGGTTRHTRAWSVGAPAVVADCRQLRLRHSGAPSPPGNVRGEETVPCACQILRRITGNSGRPPGCDHDSNMTPPQVSTATAAKKPKLPKLRASVTRYAVATKHVVLYLAPHDPQPKGQCRVGARQPCGATFLAADRGSDGTRSLIVSPDLALLTYGGLRRPVSGPKPRKRRSGTGRPWPTAFSDSLRTH